MADKLTFSQQFTNYFSSSADALIRSAQRGVARPVASNDKYLSAISKENGGRLKRVGNYKLKRTLIKGSQLQQHFKELYSAIDTGLWTFIQAAGSRSHQYFLNSFETKTLGAGTTKWHSLSDVTVENRKHLGLVGLNGFRKMQLTATKRMMSSLKFSNEQSNPKSAIKRARIYIDENDPVYKKAYPEFIATHKYKKEYSSKSGSIGYSGYNATVKSKKSSKNKYKTKSGTYPIYGRMGRFYASYHLEQASKIYRPYMSAYVPGLERSIETMLLDNYLFYGVFNRTLGFNGGGIEFRK